MTVLDFVHETLSNHPLAFGALVGGLVLGAIGCFAMAMNEGEK